MTLPGTKRLVAALAAAVVCLVAAPASAKSDRTKPNVVLIILDDLNDYAGFLGGHPQAKTPNMDALAARSTSFTDAYPTLPICAPSRASMFSGIQPYRSRSMSFDPWYKNPVLANSRMLSEHFIANGYRALGVGKILHHNRPGIWSEFHDKPDYGPVWIDNGVTKAHPSVPRAFGDIGAVDGSFAAMTADGVVDAEGRPYTGWWSTPHRMPVRYRSRDDRDLLPDEKSAQWAARRIARLTRAGTSRPFFLAVGIIKPHTPLHVPQEYFDRIAPEDEIVIPNYLEGDARDTFYHAVFDDQARGPLLFAGLVKSFASPEQGLRAFIRAYLAAIAFADDQVGTIVRAVEASPQAENTIIVLTSDHGWTNGEKDVLFKNNLWQSGSRVPLLVYLPGQAPQILDAPVSQIDLYPTLVELAGLQGDTRKNGKGRKLDGRSLVSYLRQGESAAPEFAIAMLKASNPIGRGNSIPRNQHYSVITREWRYIRYNTGQEELYDRKADPLERTNLATRAETASLRRSLAARIDDTVPGSSGRASGGANP